ncbi:MAG: hypothetical protein JWO03_793 [Bacteroidetes bacterium]|nr:hypothetical protein [Bacteroidota bacterium]
MKKCTLLFIAALSYAISYGQNVGIGETAPANKLSVKGGLSIGAGYSTTTAPTNGAIIQGQVGISTTAVDGSAALDMTNAAKGVSFPNVNLTSASDAVTIASPKTGLVVYHTAISGFGTAGLYINKGTSGAPNWTRIADAGTVTSSIATLSNTSGGGLNTFSYNGSSATQVGIATGGVTGGMIATGTVTGSNIGSATITSGNMAANSVDATTMIFNTLPINRGGTGQTTQQAAINALTGTQSSGKFLRSDGTNATLATITAADLPPGSGNYVQINPGSQQSGSYNVSGNGVHGGTITAGNAVMGSGITGGYYQDGTNGAYRSIVSSATDNGYYFQTNGGATTTMWVGLGGSNNGRVAIGNTSPPEILSVTQPISGWQSRFNNSSGTGADVYLSHGGGYGMHIRGWTASDGVYALQLYNNTTEIASFWESGRTVLGNVGNVGIGVTAPAYKLEIANGASFGYGEGTDGSYKSRTETRNDAGQQGAQSGFFQTSAPSPSADWPKGGASYSAGFDGSGNATSWYHLIDVRHSNNANNFAMQFAGSFFDPNVYFRKTNNSASTSWTQIPGVLASGDVLVSDPGVSTPSVVAGAFNISSVSYLNTGGTDSRYQINFTNALPNANYFVGFHTVDNVSSGSNWNADNDLVWTVISTTTTSFQIAHRELSSGTQSITLRFRILQ